MVAGVGQQRSVVDLGELNAELNAWTLDQVEYALKYTAATENELAEKAGNELTSAVIDKRVGKPFDDAERRVDMFYGVGGVKRAKAIVEQALKKAIKNSTNIETGSLLNDWRWRLSGGGTFSDGKLHGDVLAVGQTLYLVPVGPNRKYVALVNHLTAKAGGKIPKNTVITGTGEGIRYQYIPTIALRASIGSGRSRPARTKGFMAKAVNSARRSPEMSRFWVKVQMTGGGK